MRAITHLIIFALALLSAKADAAGQRGISVTLRQSESLNAPILEERELYQESYALVIGIDDYDNGWPRLSNAILDAELIAEALEAKGFDVELHRNPNSESLPQIFKRFFILKGENPEARLFVWFAGHGATVDGEGYLIPSDAPVITQSTEFKFSSVALRDFGTFMRQSASKHVYAVFDACFAGTVFTAQRAMPPAAITRATTLPVRQFLTSGDADQTVSDDGQFRELFVRAILGEEPADANSDGYLTASEIGMYLGDRVTNLTESAQTPRYGKLRDKDYDRGDFVFVVDPEMNPAGPVSAGAEVVFWDSVKDTGDADMLLAYLAEYPEGMFSNLARIKLKRFGERAQSGVVKVMLSALQSRLVVRESSKVREFPTEESSPLLSLPQGTEIFGLGKAVSDSSWTYVSVEGVPLGYVPTANLAEREVSNGQTEASVPSRDELDRLQERRRLNRSSDLDLRLATALGDVIADRAFDEPTSETAVQSLVQENAGTDDGISPNGRGEGQSGRLADAQATRGAESIDSTQALALPDSDDSEDSLDESSNNNSDPRPLNSAADANREDIDPPEQIDLPAVNEEESDRTSSRSQAVPAQEKTEHAQEAPADNEDLDLASSLATTDEQSASSDLADTVTDTVDSLSNDSAAMDDAPALRGTPALTPKAVAGTRVSADQESVGQESDGLESADQQDDSPAAQSSGKASEPVAYSAFVRRYINAAIGGNVGAQATLGYFYEVGEHVDADEREAIRWYEKAAENDHLQATLRLAEIQIARGNSAEGVKWYQQAATLGDRDAQAMLGFFYQTGEHVRVDLAQAIKWYLAAADQEQVTAQNNLGRLYQIGDGVDKDIDQAIYWYEKAAQNGSAAAKRNLEKLLP